MRCGGEVGLVFISAAMHRERGAAVKKRIWHSLDKQTNYVGSRHTDKGEDIDDGLLGPAVENPDLGIGDTSAEPGFNIRLVLLEAAATRRSCEANGGKLERRELVALQTWETRENSRCTSSHAAPAKTLTSSHLDYKD
jgi:hypothetical protein